MGIVASQEEKEYMHNVYIHAEMAEIVFPTHEKNTYSHQLFLCVKHGHATYEGLLELVIGVVGLDRSKIVNMPWVVWVTRKRMITTENGPQYEEKECLINSSTQTRVIANYIINPAWEFHFKLCTQGSTGLFQEDTLQNVLTKKGVY